MLNKTSLNLITIIIIVSFLKINAQTTYCGISEWNSSTIYSTSGTQVYYNCAIWENSNYTVGNQPETNQVWVWVSNCTEEIGCANNYCGFQNYISAIPYTQYSQVYYDGIIWEARYWANPGNIPGVADMWDEINTCSNPAAKTLSIEDVLLKENSKLYYYNNKLYFDFSKLENSSAVICYDIKGSLIFSKKVTNTTDEINLPSIQEGVYIIQILNNNAKTFKRIIVL